MTLPPTLKLHRRGSCVPTAIACLPQLKNGRDFVIEGWVKFGPRGHYHEHTWMDVDGQTFDPSLIQFRKLKHYTEGPQRQFSKIIPVAEFRLHWLTARSPFWIRRLREFGVDRLHDSM